MHARHFIARPLTIVAFLVLFAGCYRMVYDIYDFTPRQPTSPERIAVFTKQNPPSRRFKGVVGMVYGPRYAGGTTPSLEEALDEFKAKAASMGCDAVVFLGSGSETTREPARLGWVSGYPVYTGARDVSTSAWTAVGIVFE